MYVNIVSPEFKATVTSAIDNSCDSIVTRIATATCVKKNTV